METVLFSTYLMSNIDTYLEKEDIVNMQQSCKSAYNSLNYKKNIIREINSNLQFKQRLILIVLDAQKKNTSKNLFKIYTHCIKFQYQACLFFRNKPEILKELMSKLDCMEGNKKYNQTVVKYFMNTLLKIYANYI